jgi:inner membrane protein
MFLTHSFLGLTTAYSTRKIWDKKDFTPKDRGILYSVSIVSSVLPDFDLMIAFSRGFENHHLYITHTPFFYLFIALILLLGSYILTKKYRRQFWSGIFLFVCGVLSHIFADMLSSHIMPLYPFLNTGYQLLPLMSFLPSNIILRYFTTWYFLLMEISLLIIGIMILKKIVTDKSILSFYPLMSIIILFSIAWSMTILSIFLLNGLY